MTERPDIGQWEVEVNNQEARFRHAVVADWVSAQGSEDPPEPLFMWGKWIKEPLDSKTGLEALMKAENLARQEAARHLQAFERDKLQYTPLRSSGQVNMREINDYDSD